MGYNSDEIKNAIQTHLSKGRLGSEVIYGDGKSGKTIADILSKIDLKFEKNTNILEIYFEF